MSSIYTFLSSECIPSKSLAEIQQAFDDAPLVWVPDQKVSDPKSQAPVQGTFYHLKQVSVKINAIAQFIPPLHLDAQH
jgi:hypothetical protein